MHEQTLDHQEIEWQFDAPDLEAAESWLEEHPSASGLSVVPAGTRELTDTYYDTEDWRFYRAGYALRVRRDGKSAEATMKALAPAEGALRRRREISGPLEVKTPKGARGPVGERVRGIAGDRDLRPLFEARTRRRSFALRPEGRSEKSVGEVTLDETEISGYGLSRVEVEMGSASEFHRTVEAFVNALRDALGLYPTGASKFETGLAAAGLRPPVASSDEKQGR